MTEVSILNRNETVVCVVGLGYVGLPLAKNFSFDFKKKPLLKKQKEEKNAPQVLEVIGFDIDEEKIEVFSREDAE